MFTENGLIFISQSSRHWGLISGSNRQKSLPFPVPENKLQTNWISDLHRMSESGKNCGEKKTEKEGGETRRKNAILNNRLITE